MIIPGQIQTSKKVTIIVVVMLFFMMTADGSAETIHLKSGLSISGSIIEESDGVIKLQSGNDSYYFKFGDIQRIENSSKDYSKLLQQSLHKATKDVPVEIFITPWCPYCTNLENWLKEERIKYTKYYIETDFEGKKKYNTLRGDYSGVPLIKVGDDIIEGYDRQALLTALGRESKEEASSDSTPQHSEIRIPSSSSSEPKGSVR